MPRLNPLIAYPAGAHVALKGGGTAIFVGVLPGSEAAQVERLDDGALLEVTDDDLAGVVKMPLEIAREHAQAARPENRIFLKALPGNRVQASIESRPLKVRAARPAAANRHQALGEAVEHHFAGPGGLIELVEE